MSQADFCSLFEAPLQKQLELMTEDSRTSLRAKLDAIDPIILYRKLAEGARSAESAYSSHISGETHGLIDACLAKAKQECEQVKPHWAQLDYYDRNGVWEGINAAYSGDETQVGVAVGSFLFGGIGAVLGGALGGWMAGNRVDENFQKGLQDYVNWLTHWGDELDAELRSRILPSFQRDLASSRPSVSVRRQQPSVKQSSGNKGSAFRRVFAGFLLIAGLSVVGWHYYENQEAQTQAASDQTTEQISSLASLQGKWISDTSRGYDAVLVGDTLEFRVHSSLDPQRDGYQSGEMHFRLRVDNGKDSGFTVEQKARPVLPPSLKYSKESQDSCQELMANVEEHSLRAHLAKDRLSVDMAKVLATSESLDVRRGQVLSCKSLQQAKISRIQIALIRLPPGTEFPAVEKLVPPRKLASRSTIVPTIESTVVNATAHPSTATDRVPKESSPVRQTDPLEHSAQVQGIGVKE
ncbi:MAG: hypothetical protein JNM40_01045 [Myxococcales bacterium]|nr:hypothetical protein [Myxococcales bacterium]